MTFCSKLLRNVNFCVKLELMEAKKKIIQEIEQISEPALEEVLDFIHYLKLKHSVTSDTLMLSEKSLSKDWLKAEEDEAWRNL